MRICIGEIKKWFSKHIRALIYLVIALAGIVFLALSFFADSKWLNVLCGVGTGLLTSLIVSVIINIENDTRLKKKLAGDKRFILNDIVYYSKDVYIDIIYRINEYLIFQQQSTKYIFGVYDEFKPINDFCDSISNTDLSHISVDEKTRFEQLLNIGSYRIDHLVSELKRLPKQEYYLSGLLTKEECAALTSNSLNDRYLEYAEHISEFWNYEILDLKKCLQFMKMTLYICTDVIRAIDYCKKSVKVAEENVKENLEQQYYDEIYSQSEEYWEQMAERHEGENEYWYNHPEEYAEKEKLEEEEANKTPEDRAIETLYCCICGFCAYPLESVLQKIHSNSEKALIFLLQEDVQKALKKNWKKRKAIKNKFGNDYKAKANKIKEEPIDQHVNDIQIK